MASSQGGSRQLAAGLAAAAMLAVMGVALLAPASAYAGQGTHNWYWPTGRETFGGMDGWMANRPGAWHLAQDMSASYGSPVHAVGDGVVLESKYVDGYGPGGGKGGAVVILHKTAQGREFWAVYGHLQSLRYAKGKTVKAGAVIGSVNASSPTHLHFGIHSGRSYPSDNNPFRGHTYTRSNLYGFTDPVAFLRTEWRVIAYRAPAVPVVLRQTTETRTVEVGAVAGHAYWLLPVEEAGGEGSTGGIVAEEDSSSPEPTFVWWRRAISSGVATALASSSPPPSFDATRYAVGVNATGSAPGFWVADRRPVVRVASYDSTPPWRRSAAIRGRVANASGAAFQGLRVTLQRWSGGAWSTVSSSITLPDGSYVLPWVPRARSSVRVVVKPPMPFVASTSTTLTIAPHVALSAPRLAARTGMRVTVSGALAPRHAAGSRAVVLRFERYESGRWVRRVSTWAVLSDTVGGSVYRRTIPLPSKGKWRVRAEHPTDAAHATTGTSWVGLSIL